MEQPVIVEQIFDVSPGRLWAAITDRNEMKHWYFDLEEFRAEVGFTFSFEGGNEHARYVHDCRVTEAIPNQLLAYTWAYRNYNGVSTVSWQLVAQQEGTLLTLTHCGLHTFPAEEGDFNRQNFVEGWNYIIGSSLKNYLQKEAG